jgi:hypothetical protein
MNHINQRLSRNHTKGTTTTISRRRFMAGVTLATGISSSVGAEERSECLSNNVDIAPLRADVLVVGAGASGIPAALAAARAGANVLLADEDQSIGGAPVDMHVTMPCGFPRFGIYREVLDILEAEHDISGMPVLREDELKDRWYYPTSYILAWRRLLDAEPGLRILTGARAVGALTEDAGNRTRVKGMSFSLADGRLQQVQARIVIDATGSGEASALAGAVCRYGRESQEEFGEPFGEKQADKQVMPCTWMFISQRMRPGPAPDFEEIKSRGFIDSGLGWYAPNKEELRRRNTGSYLHWGVTVHCRDTRDPIALGEASAEAIEKARADLEWWHRHGFTMWLAPRLGVRECRRVEGDHIITMNELKEGRMPEDTIALGAYYLDAWGHKLTEAEKEVKPYGIPYGALIPKGMEGLITAGKCISGTHIAMTSYRVQCHVAMIGQAAGVAAAMSVAANTSIRDVEIQGIQKLLIASGIPIDQWRTGEVDVRWRPEKV